MKVYACDAILTTYHSSKREAMKRAKDELGFYCWFSEVWCYDLPSVRKCDVLALLDAAGHFCNIGWTCIAKFGYELTDKRERWVQSYPTHKVLRINRSRA